MLTAFQTFEEDGAIHPWPWMAMAQSHWGPGPLVACPVGKPGYAWLLRPGSGRLCELCGDSRSPAAEENGQAGNEDDEGRAGQF